MASTTGAAFRVSHPDLLRPAESRYKYSGAGGVGTSLLWANVWEARNTGKIFNDTANAEVDITDGVYKVTVTIDTESPAAGDITRLAARVDGTVFSYMQVEEASQQTAVWSVVLDAAGTTMVLSVVRDTVTGTGGVDAELHIRELV